MHIGVVIANDFHRFGNSWQKNLTVSEIHFSNMIIKEARASLMALTLFLPAMGWINPYTVITWHRPVGIGLKCSSDQNTILKLWNLIFLFTKFAHIYIFIYKLSFDPTFKNLFNNQTSFTSYSPCWSPLVFWNIHFGIRFKLG